MTNTFHIDHIRWEKMASTCARTRRCDLRGRNTFKHEHIFKAISKWSLNKTKCVCLYLYTHVHCFWPYDPHNFCGCCLLCRLHTYYIYNLHRSEIIIFTCQFDFCNNIDRNSHHVLLFSRVIFQRSVQLRWLLLWKWRQLSCWLKHNHSKIR